MLVHDKSSYKFCPGILSYDESFADHVRFVPHKLHRCGFPSKQCNSMTCKVLFQLGRTAPMENRVLESVTCTECKRFEKELNALKKTTMDRSAAQQQQQHLTRPVSFFRRRVNLRA
eukprot:scpid96437/ scgid18215/ 